MKSPEMGHDIFKKLIFTTAPPLVISIRLLRYTWKTVHSDVMAAWEEYLSTTSYIRY